MRVLVFGSRWYSRGIMIETWLDGLYLRYGDDLKIIEGGARGADKFAHNWAEEKWGKDSDNLITEKADWDKYGKGAGAIRNQKMIDDYNPELGLGFKDDFDWDFKRGGSEDMAKRLSDANIPVFIIERVSNDNEPF